MKAASRWMAVGLVAAALVVAGSAGRLEAVQWWKLAWTLDVESTAPKYVPVEEPGGEATIYAYFTYTITNRTLRDVNLVPLVTLVTDTHKTYYSQTQPLVKAIAERQQGKSLLTPVEMIGPLKIGESRTGIVILKAVDPTAKEWHLYFGGLSGEYVLQLIPGQAQPLVLHKAYHAVYRNLGDEFNPRDDELERVKTEWTYR